MAFFSKFCVRSARFGADANHLGVQLLKLGQALLETLGFNAATQRTVFGVKIQNHPPATKLLEGDGFAGVADGRKIWSGFKNLHQGRLRGFDLEDRKQSSRCSKRIWLWNVVEGKR